MRNTTTLLLYLSAAGFAQQPALRSQIAELYRQQSGVQPISRANLSPDGLRVAWSVREATGEAIFVSRIAEPAAPMRVNGTHEHKACNDNEPIWSSTGNELAFLSDCETPGQAQLYVASLGEMQPHARQLTHLKGFLSHPQWSPDATEIALLFVGSATRAPTPMAAENKAVGVIDDLRNADIQRLVVANVRTGEMREVTPPSLYVFEYDWSPDGRSFAFTAAPPPGDDNWYVAELYTQSSTGSKPVTVYKPQWQIALPRWSPSGRSIAFIEGLMSDEGGTGGEIFAIAASGGRPTNLTPGRTSTPAWFKWLSDHEMLLTEYVGGSTAIGRLDVGTRQVTRLWLGQETIRSESEEASLSASDRGARLHVAVVRMSWSMLPEVWAGIPGEWKQITHVNSKANLPLPNFENVSWTSGDFHVQGWLLYPREYDPAKRYPLLVAVHGGPAWIAMPAWRSPDFNATLLTNFCYFVFFPNARGGYGQGENFTRANRRDWGFGDLQDILAGVQTVTRNYSVDKDRVGILGWSYGGSMAMMAITQTNRFRAAVAGAGAGNWQSYYGQNSIDHWMIPYFGASVYDDPTAYAKCSAITYVKRARTPTLIVVGERDGEAPPAQSIEYWHALKELNVPTRLVIYPDEGHRFFRESDEVDVTLRTLEWFGQYMAAK